MLTDLGQDCLAAAGVPSYEIMALTAAAALCLLADIAANLGTDPGVNDRYLSLPTTPDSAADTPPTLFC